jgi:glycosyltransferase involved in cell wall biosynthesis
LNICLLTSSFPAHRGDHIQAPFLVPFIGRLKRRGHRVFVFTQDRQEKKEDFLEDVRIKWFSWMGFKKPLVHLRPFHPFDEIRIGSLFLKGRREVLPFLRENRIEACLALWVLPSGLFANHAFRRLGIPYSLWALGSDIYRLGRNPLLRPIMRRIVREARSVFADGFDLARKVEEGFHRPCSFLATTRPLKDLDGPKPQNAPPYRFLYVGRLERVKGIDLLLQAVDLLADGRVEASLTVVGSGGLERWARRFVAERDLGRSVSILGNVPDETLASLYASCDCVMIPSRSESIPLVFSEALRFDKDLIVTDVGDMGMLGRQYEVAKVVPPESPAALRDAMVELVRLRTGGKKVPEYEGRRADLIRMFDIETSVERFLEDYVH